MTQCCEYTGRHDGWRDGLNDDKAFTMVKKKGRPPFPYNENLADEICGVIASSSKGLDPLCKENPHWPSRETIYQWLANNTAFSDKYARAKMQQAGVYVDEIIEISDDASRDAIINELGVTVSNHAAIARDKLRVDSRKLLASKLAPKVYGMHKPQEMAPEPVRPAEAYTLPIDPIEAAKAYQQFMRRDKP